jgi:hypothetical protein
VVATILIFGYCSVDLLDHLEEGVRVELGVALACDFGAFHAESFLQVFFVADQAVDVLGDLLHDLLSAPSSPPTLAQSLAR